MTTAATLQFVSAVSDGADTDEAVKCVAAELAGQLSGPAGLVVAFATAHHGGAFDEIAGALDGALQPAVMLATTCQGVIGVRREVEEGPGLSVLAAAMPGVSVQPFHFDTAGLSRFIEAPQTLDGQLDPSLGRPEAIILLADPFSTPQDELLAAFARVMPGLPVIGGMASGARRPGGNCLLVNGRVHHDGAMGVSIGGDIRVDCTVSQGCRPIGAPYVITKSDRNIIQELGGRNAVQVAPALIESLGDDDRRLIADHALFLGRVTSEYKDRFGRGDFLIRNIVGVDQDAGHIAIGDPRIRVGQRVQFQVRDGATAAEDFALLLDLQKLHGPAGGALLFSCNGRGRHMFGRPDADAELVADALGDIPLAGLFAMGEIGPVGDQNFVHGHTASLAVFRGRESVIGDQ